MMKRKNILVISNMYPTEEHKSFGIFVKNQVEALRHSGVQADVLAVKDPSGGKPAVLKKYGKWFASTLSNLLVKGRGYGVVHAHYVFPSGMLALMYKKIFGARMIVTAHGGDIDKMARKNDRLFSWTKKIMQEADEVIAVGIELKAAIESEFGIPSEKVTLLNMGVNRDVFRQKDTLEAKREIGLPEEEKAIVFTGNLIRQKGLKELVQAVSKLRSGGEKLKLYLIGPAKDARFLQELKEDIKQLGAEEYIVFPGVKPQKEIAIWMAAADVFVLPSHIEGFGLVALEAMSCGTPVVGTNVGGLKHLLTDDSGCIVKVQNAEDLHQGINKVIQDCDYRSRLIDNGIHKAEENDQKYIIEKLLTLYFPTGG